MASKAPFDEYREQDQLATASGVRERQFGYWLFVGFTIALWAVCIGTGLVVGIVKGTGLGLGDTQVVAPEHHAMPTGSFWSDAWRIVISLAALAVIPMIWYWFLKYLGDFGFGGQAEPVSDELVQLKSLRESELRHPMAAALAYRTSLASLIFLLIFGNFFLPYVVIRWGWGGA